MRRLCLPVFTVLAAAAAGPASAQEPPAQTAQLPPAAAPKTQPAPAPAPAAGRMSVRLFGGLSTRGLRWFVRGQRVVVVGSVRPFVAGQVVTLSVIRRHRVTERHRVRVKNAGRGRGRFIVRLTARRRGSLRLVAKHARTAAQVAFRSRSKRLRVVRWTAGQGSHGTRVVLLQRTLRSLGFGAPVSGSYGPATSRAVLAYRKTNRLRRTGFASASVYAKLFRKRGRFKLRYPKAGRHVEFDWSRQVLVLADHGRAFRVIHASSGKPATPTVFGTFRFYMKQPGTNSHQMVNSSYFIRGYAIHGYFSVPSFAASHGCIRVPIANARAIYNWIPLGMRIFVYR
jgi:L,D-transpeptidase-like protein/putative peptidoglycan binding protein